MWLGNDNILCPEQCLAIRVDLLQRKGQYRSPYEFLSQNNVHVLQAPGKMESCENLFLSSAAVYQIMQDFVELATPNCLGVRFSYFDALSVSVQELEPEIVNGLENQGLNVENVILHTTVKDGCDGMGEVSIYKEKDFKMLPDKAFRFSFCIVNIEAVHQGTKV